MIGDGVVGHYHVGRRAGEPDSALHIPDSDVRSLVRALAPDWGATGVEIVLGSLVYSHLGEQLMSTFDGSVAVFLVLEFPGLDVTTKDLISVVAQLRVALDNGFALDTLLLVVDRRELAAPSLYAWLSDVRVVIGLTDEPYPLLEVRGTEITEIGGFAGQIWATTAPKPDILGHTSPFLEPRDLDLLFGHFRLLRVPGVHTNVVPRLGRLASKSVSVKEVERACYALTRDGGFALGFDGTFIEELGRIALLIVGGDVGRIANSPGPGPGDDKNRNLVLLYDELDSKCGVIERIAEYERDGWSNIFVVGLCRTYMPFELPVQSLALCTLPDIAGMYLQDACPYCEQHVPLIPPADVTSASPRDLEWRPGAFEDPKVFWDLLSWSDRFAEFGHWRSSRTDNHFTLRVLAGPIFDTFGLSIALRLRSAMMAAGILPTWIGGLVCTDGAESSELIARLCEVLGTSPRSVLRIPGALLRESAQSGLGPGLTAWLETEGIGAAKAISGRNVILVDQAVHHFNTYSALRRVAVHLKCTTLAFAVLVSRPTNQEDVGAVMHGVHFVPLFSWSNSAWTRFTCPCGVT